MLSYGTGAFLTAIALAGATPSHELPQQGHPAMLARHRSEIAQNVLLAANSPVMLAKPGAANTALDNNPQIMQVDPSAGPTSGAGAQHQSGTPLIQHPWEIMHVDPSQGPNTGGVGGNPQIMQVNPSQGPNAGGVGSKPQIMQINPSQGPNSGGVGSNPQIMQIDPPSGSTSGNSGQRGGSTPLIQHPWQIMRMPAPDLKGSESS